MALRPGTYEAGPSSGRLRLRTYRQGVAARAGHDLVLEARAWRARIRVPADPAAQPSVDAEVDLRELHVVEGTGGVKPLTEGDKEDIHRSMQKTLRTDQVPLARFSSSVVQVDDERATIEGTLALAGVTRPLRLEVEQAPDGRLAVTTSITQTQWGIKPYSGFLGALKLRDEVELEVGVDLDSA